MNRNLTLTLVFSLSLVMAGFIFTNIKLKKTQEALTRTNAVVLQLTINNLAAMDQMFDRKIGMYALSAMQIETIETLGADAYDAVLKELDKIEEEKEAKGRASK